MKKTMDLTRGTPWKLILTFSLPVLLGRVFQIFYSLVDTKIVGMYLGEEALAAVGSVSTLYTLFNGFLNGVTLGFSVLTAMYFGARKYDKLKQTYGQGLVLGLILTVVLSVVCCVCMNPILTILNVPEEAFDMARSYIFVLAAGLVVTLLYNHFANMLRAIGDAVTPLLFLILSSVLNVGLDILLIRGFQAGVAGAAYATVLAQLVSVVLCYIRIRRKFPLLHAKAGDYRLEREMASELIKSGMSLGLMSCLISIGTLALQMGINTLGTAVIVAHTAARKVFEISVLPFSAFGAAMTTYCGQNYGAKEYGRIRQGIRSTLLIGMIWSAFVAVMTLICGRFLIHFIASTVNEDVLYWGTMYLRVNISLLAICCFVIILRNAMQGYGERRVPVFSSFLELFCKVVVAIAFVPLFGYWGIIWAEPVSWTVMVIPLIIRTILFVRKHCGGKVKSEDM